MLFRKTETVEILVGSYLLVSIPYGDVILLKDELHQLWSLLPSNTFSIDQVHTYMKEIGIDSNRKNVERVLDRFLEMGLVIKE